MIFGENSVERSKEEKMELEKKEAIKNALETQGIEELFTRLMLKMLNKPEIRDEIRRIAPDSYAYHNGV